MLIICQEWKQMPSGEALLCPSKYFPLSASYKNTLSKTGEDTGDRLYREADALPAGIFPKISNSKVLEVLLPVFDNATSIFVLFHFVDNSLLIFLI
jgi:hypothetical protein